MVSPLAVAVPLSAAFLVVRAERSTVIDTVYVTITRTIHNYTGSPYTEYLSLFPPLDKNLCLSRPDM